MFTFDARYISFSHNFWKAMKSELQQTAGKRKKNMWYTSNYEAVLQAICASVPPIDDDIDLEYICKYVRFIWACTSVTNYMLLFFYSNVWSGSYTWRKIYVNLNLMLNTMAECDEVLGWSVVPIQNTIPTFRTASITNWCNKIYKLPYLTNF
jgi:hypothetical protein